MLAARRVPLAWSNLTHNKVKLLGALAGVTFAVTLMFVEGGFRNALLDGMTGLLRALDADLVVLSRTSYTTGFKRTFPRQQLYDAARFEGVANACPVYLESARAVLRNPVTGLRRPIRAVGVRPGDDVFLDPAVRAHARALKGPETAVFDVSGKTDVYGVSSVGVRTELAGRPIHLVGAFRLGADFLNDGTLVMTDRNYAHYFGGPNGVDPDRLAVDLGLLKLTRRGDRALAERVKNEVARVLPASVTVCTKDELIEGERDFWLTNTPIGFVFTLGLVMGFVVGTIICYQIFFSDITSYLREYATLLAMGYSRGYLVSVVLQEAVYLGFLGFACGTLVSLGVYAAAQEETRLPFVMDAGRALVVLGATLAMCVTAACFAIQKLWRAAPAELF